MYVSIEIRYSETLGRWSWFTEVDDTSAYGYENDYENAAGQARQAARRMGAEL